MDTRQLNGDTSELIIERTGDEGGWRDRMGPVRKHGNPHILWHPKTMRTTPALAMELGGSTCTCSWLSMGRAVNMFSVLPTRVT